MSDIADTINDSAEAAANSRINSVVALMVAITATFMALCNVKDGNIVQAMGQAQARGLDSWSLYQSKSTKQALAENTLELLKIQGTHIDEALLIKHQEQIHRYDTEKSEIKKQAEDFQKQYDDLNLFDDQFDMTEAMLTISIAMFGICSLTQKKWLLYFAIFTSVSGILLGISAFLKISLHSEFVSKLLG